MLEQCFSIDYDHSHDSALLTTITPREPFLEPVLDLQNPVTLI